MKEGTSNRERFPWRPACIENNNHLCERCSALNLGSLADLQKEKERGTIAFIEKASIRKSCRLCAQFGRIFAWARSIRNESSGHDSFTLDYRRFYTEQWKDFYIRVRFMEFSQILDFDFDFYPTSDQSRTWTPIIKTMLSTSADLDLARQWLDLCQSSHVSCQRLKTRFETLRVISCRDRTLCHIDSLESYACLSYVWGENLTEEHGNLASKLQQTPQTIEDAISVTLSLGISYLWVDRYCIDQDDLQEKHNIIRNMDQIYQGSEVTIVAPTGHNPHYGLPGLGTSRRPQLSLSVGEHTFVSTENIREQIHASIWSSRGWTYQEMLMSRRRLVFTDSQMYFQCGCAVWLEALDFAATDHQSQLYDQFRAFPNFGVNARFDNIHDRLKEYYRRRLSFGTDAIHAFAGICNAQRTATKPVPLTLTHFYGIPVASTANLQQGLKATFIKALSWRVLHRDSTLEPLTFPLIFPTWSWASVKARTPSGSDEGEYMKPFLFSTDQADLQISLQSKDGHLVELGRILRDHVRTDYANFEPVLHVTGFVLRGFPTSTFSGIVGTGALLLDSRDEPDFTNVAALLLGVARETSKEGPSRVVYRHRFYWLLLESLSPEQMLCAKCIPSGQRGFRRVGMWTRTMTPSTVADDGEAASEPMRALRVEKIADEKITWTLSRETFYFV